MTDLDKLFHDANDDLRTGLRNIDVPDFTPAPRRAPMIAAALALVLAIGVGGVLVGRDTTPAPDELVVTTQPEADDGITQPALATEPEPQPIPASPIDEPEELPATPIEDPEEQSVEEQSAEEQSAEEQSGEEAVAEFVPGEVRQLTSSVAGEFIMPIPAASAWNADETHLLLYRTGVTGAAHLIIDATTGSTVAIPDIDPPDIEQVWWHPTDADSLIYFEGTDLKSWSLASQSASVLRSFPECDNADSGLAPSPPSPSGFLGFLCHRGSDLFEASEPYVVSLDGSTVHAGRGWFLNTAPRVSNDGELVLIRDESDIVTPFERSTFEMINVQEARLEGTGGISLEGDPFIVVTLADGSQAIAAAQYRGDIFGNLIVHPLDGSAPLAVLDDEAAGGYPASGTRMHASVGQGPSIVAVSISTNSPDSPLAGKLLVFDLADLDPADPSSLTPLFEIDHASTGQHDYWSSVFVSVSPSGRFVAWSSDQGGDRVDTFVVELAS